MGLPPDVHPVPQPRKKGWSMTDVLLGHAGIALGAAAFNFLHDITAASNTVKDTPLVGQVFHNQYLERKTGDTSLLKPRPSTDLNIIHPLTGKRSTKWISTTNTADGVKLADSCGIGRAEEFGVPGEEVRVQLGPPIDNGLLRADIREHIGKPYKDADGKEIVMPQSGVDKALGKVMSEFDGLQVSTAIQYTRFLGELATLAPGLVRKAAGQKWVPGLCRAGGVAFEVIGGIYIRLQYDDEDDNTGWWLWAEICLEVVIRAGLSIYVAPSLTALLLVPLAPFLPGGIVGCIACAAVGVGVSYALQSSVTLLWPQGRKVVRAASRWVFAWF